MLYTVNVKQGTCSLQTLAECSGKRKGMHHFIIQKRHQRRKAMPPINFRDWINSYHQLQFNQKAYSHFKVTKYHCKYLAVCKYAEWEATAVGFIKYVTVVVKAISTHSPLGTQTRNASLIKDAKLQALDCLI